MKLITKPENQQRMMEQNSILKTDCSSSRRDSSKWSMHCRHLGPGTMSLDNCYGVARPLLPTTAKSRQLSRARISFTSSVFASKSGRKLSDGFDWLRESN